MEVFPDSLPELDEGRIYRTIRTPLKMVVNGSKHIENDGLIV
jgi:hypothetical protein